MPARKFPVGATEEVQEAFREVWRMIDTVLGTRNVDWHGRRIINAGDAVDPGDYITKRQLGDTSDTIAAALVQQERRLRQFAYIVNQRIDVTQLVVDNGLGDALWPITSVFVGSTSVNPADLLGFGTWELIAVGAGAEGGPITFTRV